MKDFSQREMSRRKIQSESSTIATNAAALEMRRKTLEQGRQMLMKACTELIDSRTKSGWHVFARIALPRWYERFWMKSLAATLWLAHKIWFVISFIFGLHLMRRVSKIAHRGGHIARVYPTDHEWTLRIKLYRWWVGPIYECDFDIRTGVRSEAVNREVQNAATH